MNKEKAKYVFLALLSASGVVLGVDTLFMVLADLIFAYKILIPNMPQLWLLSKFLTDLILGFLVYKYITINKDFSKYFLVFFIGGLIGFWMGAMHGYLA